MTNEVSEKQIKLHSKSFYLASCFLSSKHAKSAAELYAVCRCVDDIADNNDDPLIAQQRLINLIIAIETKDLSDPICQSFFAITPQLNPKYFLELISGVSSDLEQVRIKTETELIQYAYAVAGTVGLMMCDVFEIQNSLARQHAIDLGIAMQFTNIARDVVDDAHFDRRYLPSEWITSLEPSVILNPSAKQKLLVKKGLVKLLNLADSYYESGLIGLIYLPFRARLAIMIATRIYRQIGLDLAKKEFDVWGRRTIVSMKRKILICLFSFVSIGVIKTIKKHQFRLY